MFFFSFGIIVPLLWACYLVAVGAINVNPSGLCWVNSMPAHCRLSNVGWCKEHKTWGEQLQLYLLGSVFIWVFLGVTIVSVSMVLLFLAVRRQEKRVSKWSNRAKQGHSQKAVLKTASLYIGTNSPCCSFEVVLSTYKDSQQIMFLPLTKIQVVFVSSTLSSY